MTNQTQNLENLPDVKDHSILNPLFACALDPFAKTLGYTTTTTTQFLHRNDTKILKPEVREAYRKHFPIASRIGEEIGYAGGAALPIGAAVSACNGDYKLLGLVAAFQTLSLAVEGGKYLIRRYRGGK